MPGKQQAHAVATITAMEDEGMVDNAARIGTDVLGPGLRELAAANAAIIARDGRVVELARAHEEV